MKITEKSSQEGFFYEINNFHHLQNFIKFRIFVVYSGAKKGFRVFARWASYVVHVLNTELTEKAVEFLPRKFTISTILSDESIFLFLPNLFFQNYKRA